MVRLYVNKLFEGTCSTMRRVTIPTYDLISASGVTTTCTFVKLILFFILGLHVQMCAYIICCVVQREQIVDGGATDVNAVRCVGHVCPVVNIYNHFHVRNTHSFPLNMLGWIRLISRYRPVRITLVGIWRSSCRDADYEMTAYLQN